MAGNWWAGTDDSLESPYREKELIYRGLGNAKAQALLESQMAAGASKGGTSGAGYGFPDMAGFQQAEQNRQVARDALALSQNADEANNWAAGREIQHDRNLQNAEMQRRMYDSQTARYVSDNELRGTQAIASGLNIGAGLFQPAGQGGQQSAPGTVMYGPGGEVIGGSGMGGALSGLNSRHQPQPQPMQMRRWR